MLCLWYFWFLLIFFNQYSTVRPQPKNTKWRRPKTEENVNQMISWISLSTTWRVELIRRNLINGKKCIPFWEQVQSYHRNSLAHSADLTSDLQHLLRSQRMRLHYCLLSSSFPHNMSFSQGMTYVLYTDVLNLCLFSSLFLFLANAAPHYLSLSIMTFRTLLGM